MKEVIDFHTHTQNSDPNILNVYIPPYNKLGPHKNLYYCLGIHPWEINKSPQKQIEKLDELLKNHHKDQLFFALGEIGIDKVKTSDTNLKIQEDVFKAQIEIAKKYKIKTLVLHCVKSYQEIYGQLKSLDFQGNLLLHAFEGNYQVYQQFDRDWDTYISFSKKSLLYPKNHQLITQLPPPKILIETDDNTNISITDTFNTLVNILGISRADLLKYHHQSLILLRQN